MKPVIITTLEKPATYCSHHHHVWQDNLRTTRIMRCAEPAWFQVCREGFHIHAHSGAYGGGTYCHKHAIERANDEVTEAHEEIVAAVEAAERDEAKKENRRKRAREAVKNGIG